MDEQSLDAVIKFFLQQMSERFDQASGIAKAGLACANAGNAGKAVEIVLDVEQLAYEAANLLNALSTINHIGREDIVDRKG